MSAEVHKHHFICLPYISLGNVPEIDLGFAKIWNFDQQKEKYLPNQALRDHVSRILENYRASYPYGDGDSISNYFPVHGIGLISTGTPTETPFDAKNRQAANDARLILFISFIAYRNTITRDVNTGHGMASAENFSPVYFTAVVGSEYMSEHAGFVNPSIHGGIEINKNVIIRPKYVQAPRFETDVDLLRALIRVRTKRKRAFRRIVSAIEVFYESYSNSPEVSHNARILLQASAFEILLETNGDARREFKNFLRKNADYPDERKYPYVSERSNGKVERELDTKKVIWADRFFTLRNHIAHGDIPNEKAYLFGEWQRHFDIALYFFVFCLKRKLEEVLGKELFGDDVEWKTWTDDLSVEPHTYTGFVYEPLGRRGWERMLAKHGVH